MGEMGLISVRLPKALQDWVKGRAIANYRSASKEITALVAEARARCGDDIPTKKTSLAKREAA